MIKNKESIVTFLTFFMGIGIILICLGILLSMIGNLSNLDGKKVVEKVDCFDKFGNKIIGETCEKVSYNSEIGEELIGIGMLLAFIGFLIFLICFLILFTFYRRGVM